MKKYLFITVLLLCGIFSNLLAATVTWDFNSPVNNNQTDGWNIVYYTNGNTSGGVLNLTAQTYGNMRLDQYANPYNPSVYKYAVIKLKNTTAQTAARFYWWGVGDNTPYYSEFTITPNDTGFKEYVVDLSADINWTKHTSGVRVIRFDVPTGIVGASIGKIISIDQIKLSSTPPCNFRLPSLLE